MTNKQQNKPMQRNLPKISIVTPSYNSMPYLIDTIKSIQDQNYPKVEHIIFDGNSNDGTVELLKTYPHLKWVSEKDDGQSHALNKGFSIVTGDIIGWLNADDTYNPNTFNTVVDYFEKHPESDLVGTDINIIDHEGNLIGYSKSEEFDIIKLLTYNMVKQPTVFFRKKVIEQLGGVNESLHYVMDYEFWLRIGMAGFRFDYIPDKVFANFRLITGTKTFESEPAFHEEWYKIVKEAFKHSYLRNTSERKKSNILRANKASIFVALMIKAVNTMNRKAVFHNFLQAIKTDFKLILNIGMWKLLVFGILGIKHDIVNKFKKGLKDIGNE